MEELLFSFEHLDVWQNARRLVRKIYETTETFPPTEQFGLSSQIRRAAVSVASNIAEGTTCASDKDKLRFLEITYGSLMEVFCQLRLASDIGYLGNEAFAELTPSIIEISKQLSGLRRAYISRSR